MYQSAYINFKIVNIILLKSKFNNDIIKIILHHYWNILKNKRKVLVDWISIDNVNWQKLSLNPNAIDLLRDNKDKIHWGSLSLNTNAIELLTERFHYEIKNNIVFDKTKCDKTDDRYDYYYTTKYKIDYSLLSLNQNAISLIKKKIKLEIECLEDLCDLDKINWNNLCLNINAIDILSENLNKINWCILSLNKNAVELLKKQIKLEKQLVINDLYYSEKINWNNICINSNAEQLLNNNFDKINWKLLSSNEMAINLIKNNLRYVNWQELSKNKNAIDILENNLNKVDWINLHFNENAISILSSNIDKIYWDKLCENSNANELLQVRIAYENLFSQNDKEYLNALPTSPDTYEEIVVLKLYNLSRNYDYKINWSTLSLLCNNLELLRNNQNKINWFRLSENSNIFCEECMPVIL